MVHRDFKPDNVLIDIDGRVLVTDFGLAVGDARAGDDSGSPLSHSATSEGVAGTPTYMAPEQHTGDPVDARADQFGFCVALYEALYGELPFAGTSRRDYVRAIYRGEIKPSPPGSKVPGWLREIILRGLAADPAARHRSMQELLAELGAEPGLVKHQGWRERSAVAIAGFVGMVVWSLAVGLSGVEISYALLNTVAHPVPETQS